jgi:hypothetical protein
MSMYVWHPQTTSASYRVTNRERCTSCSKKHMRLGSGLPSREEEARDEMRVIE